MNKKSPIPRIASAPQKPLAGREEHSLLALKNKIKKDPCFCAHKNARKNTNKKILPLLRTARRIRPHKNPWRDAKNRDPLE